MTNNIGQTASRSVLIATTLFLGIFFKKILSTLLRPKNIGGVYAHRKTHGPRQKQASRAL